MSGSALTPQRSRTRVRHQVRDHVLMMLATAAACALLTMLLLALTGMGR